MNNKLSQNQTYINTYFKARNILLFFHGDFFKYWFLKQTHKGKIKQVFYLTPLSTF